MTEPDLRETFGDFLAENGGKYKEIVVLDADLSLSTKTIKFAKLFPDRFFNMGIAEQNMLGVALGLAISGKTPIISGFTIFTTGRAWEFIRMACHDNLNIKIITTHSGFVGKDGSTHHSLEDLTLMSTLPNITVLVPVDNIELKRMLNLAFKTVGPFYIRLPRGSFPKIHDENYSFSIGMPDVLKEGNDLCIIGMGYGSVLALKSASSIEERFHKSIKVINLSSIKPINEKVLMEIIGNMRGILVIEEHNIYCGFGSIIARIVSKNHPIPMRFMGIENTFGKSGSREELLNSYGLNEENVMKKVQDLIK